MFGYIDKKAAKESGFTHQATYYGIPLWLIVSKQTIIAAKWPPMELMISFLQSSEVYLKTKWFPWVMTRHSLMNVEAI